VWSFESWKGGGFEAGWLQFQPRWMDTHHYFVTLPCHSFLTAGKLECPHCLRLRPLCESAYVAWYGETGKPKCSLVKSYSRPGLDKLRPNEAITVGKGKDKFTPVFVRPRANVPQWVPTPGTERTEEQFQRWLLRLWKLPELVEFFSSDKPVSLAGVAPPPAPDPGRRGRAPVYTPDQERELIQGCLPVRPAGGDGGGLRLLGEALPPPPVPNGKHRKPPE
jgi:hypothetical protein